METVEKYKNDRINALASSDNAYPSTHKEPWGQDKV